MIQKIIQIARQAGQIIEEAKNEKQITKSKEDGTVVTTTDLKVDKFIIEQLNKFFPDIEVLTEETVSVITKDTFFIIDPLDGTQEFLNSIKDPSLIEYAVMIGLVKQHIPVLGVVYLPATKTLYYAEQGKGAFKECGDKTEQIYTKNSNKILIGKYNVDEDLELYLKNKYNLTSEQTFKGGSFGVKVCQLAEGLFQEFIHTNYDKNKIHASIWDSCASDIILKEAGGFSHTIKTLESVNYKQIELTNGYIASSNKFNTLFIFDIDGVLGNFEKLRKLRDVAHCKAIANKHNITEKQAIKLLNETRIKLKQEGKHSTIDAMRALGVSEKEFYDIMNSVPVEGNIVLTSHVVELLQKLKSGNAIVALTNTPTKAILATLEYLGLLHFFDAVYCIDKYNFVKPSIEIYKTIMGDFKAKEVISIGDSEEKDLKPAKQLNLKTFYFSTKDDSSDIRALLDFF
ncbi:MAG: inositol monophosphatase family protein [Nanoarchaeota archaeon]|nr:inositol monophosphatase family protein [Nanoarchaeota archaeon]